MVNPTRRRLESIAITRLSGKRQTFIILAAALGYGISKAGGAFFRGRTQEIQKGIVEATKLREDAEARAAEMDRRMENLGAEIESLREKAKTEMATEQQRASDETEHLLARMQANAEQEIASTAKQARKQLRAYSTELALELARRKIHDRMTPAVAGGLVDSFVEDLADISQEGKVGSPCHWPLQTDMLAPWLM